MGGATDNIEESCAVFTSRALGLETPLMTTHQIDNCSEGWFVYHLYNKHVMLKCGNWVTNVNFFLTLWSVVLSRVLLGFPWTDKGMLLPDRNAVCFASWTCTGNAKFFLFLQQEKQVKKVYLALTTAPVSTGIITHYMRPVNRAPRLVSEGNFWTEIVCVYIL